MIFDVTSAYFYNNGGYEFARKYYEEAVEENNALIKRNKELVRENNLLKILGLERVRDIVERVKEREKAKKRERAWKRNQMSR